MRIDVTVDAVGEFLMHGFAMRLRPVAIRTWGYILMLFRMAVGTVESGMHLARSLQIICYPAMACCTHGGIKIIGVGNLNRAVGFMAFGAVLDNHFIGVAGMAVKAVQELTFTQAVSHMACVTVHLGMHTRMGFHLLALRRMTAKTG
jgi:hypothetical protein